MLTCYDRIIIQGVIPSWSYTQGMTGYLKTNGIRIFDFADFSQPLTDKIRENAEQIAKENNIQIEFIRTAIHTVKPEDLEQLFTEYSRFNTESNRATEGTGLGLSITKNLIAMMSGDIQVKVNTEKAAHSR